MVCLDIESGVLFREWGVYGVHVKRCGMVHVKLEINNVLDKGGTLIQLFSLTVSPPPGEKTNLCCGEITGRRLH